MPGFMPEQPAPNVPAGYDPVTGAIYEAPWYDPNRGRGNPLQDLISQLTRQAGPRGATFAGRLIQPNQPSQSLKDLMAQAPMDVPEEGYGMMTNIDPAGFKSMAQGLDKAQGLKGAMTSYNIGLSKAAQQDQQRNARRNNNR